MKRIHWLASYPKSGNTWVRALLSAYQRAGRIDINRITNSVGDLNDYWHQVCAPKPVDQLDLADYLMVRPAALLHMTEAQQGDPLIVKTHNVNAMVDRCQLQPPQLTASAVYLIRDPRDLVISWAQHLCYSIDVTIDKTADPAFVIKTGSGLPHILSTWSKHVMSWTDENAWPTTVVRYEDLLEDTEEIFAGILEHLGIEPDPKRVALAVEACRIEKLQAQEAEHGFGEKRLQERFFNRGTAGHWREVLTAEQAALIERCHAKIMERFGYELSTAAEEAA